MPFNRGSLAVATGESIPDLPERNRDDAGSDREKFPIGRRPDCGYNAPGRFPKQGGHVHTFRRTKQFSVLPKGKLDFCASGLER
jgi:hypothetical protein